MDSDDMVTLNNMYMKILKTGKNLYTKSDANQTIKAAQQLESYTSYLENMNNILENILKLTDQYAQQCLDKATEIRESVDMQSIDDPSKMFAAYANLNKGISWADLSDKEETTDRVLKSVDDIIDTNISKKDFTFSHIMYKNINNIYDASLGFDFQIPIISKINEMPSALYWYKGDTKYPPGIYICISQGFYVQVPFPNVVDSTKDFNRTGSIKCKYTTTDECYKVRAELANKYNSDVRHCNFAHMGDKYVKIGTSFRCPSLPRFGNHNNIQSDINNVDDTDINTILMYSLSDMLLSAIWVQKNKKNAVLTNIDIC